MSTLKPTTPESTPQDQSPTGRRAGRQPVFTFANVASATALVVALGGGGAAVAAGLAKNSVGSPQIKSGAVKTSDLSKNAVTAQKIKKGAVGTGKLKNSSVTGTKIKNNSVTGADVNEGTLGTVPKASEVAGMTSVQVSAAAGESSVIYTMAPFSVRLDCADLGGGTTEGVIILTTSTNDSVMDANLDGDEYSPFDVGDEAWVADESSAGVDIEDSGFTAIAPDGRSLRGYGAVAINLTANATCTADMTFWS